MPRSYRDSLHIDSKAHKNAYTYSVCHLTRKFEPDSMLKAAKLVSFRSTKIFNAIPQPRKMEREGEITVIPTTRSQIYRFVRDVGSASHRYVCWNLVALTAACV